MGDELVQHLIDLVKSNHADNKADIAGVKNEVRDLSGKVVSQDVYMRGERENERRFMDLTLAIRGEREDRKASVDSISQRMEAEINEVNLRVDKGDQAISDRMDKSSSNWRSNIWQTVSLIGVVVGTAINLWAVTKGT